MNVRQTNSPRPPGVGRWMARTLLYYWRSHVCMALSVAACTAVIAGALAVGDSMRYTLRRMSGLRVGPFQYALFTGDRYVRASLADTVGAIPVLSLQGVAANDEGSRRVNGITVLGVDARFSAAAPAARFPLPEAGAVALNSHLARKLGVGVGDEVVLRMPRAEVAGELALESERQATVALRANVAAVVDDEHLGRFALGASFVPPLNAYVSLSQLQALMDASGRANLLLTGPDTRSLDDVNAALRGAWSLADAGLTLRALPDRGALELRGASIFLDAASARAGLAASTGAVGILTYLVNSISAQARSTPYSFVAGMPVLPHVASQPGPGEIAITDWLADDLGVTNGADLTLRYYTLGALRSLVETSAVFRVAAVVPLAETADPTLMPVIPGLSDSGSCREWESGVPIDLQRIRPKDESYWDAWRGAPKAFIALEAAQGLWSNRWGNVTAIRYGVGGQGQAELEARIRSGLGGVPAFTSLRADAERAWRQAMDFGQLFLGLSLFLLMATILMTAYLFKLAAGQRQEQTGLLLALGFGRNQVRRWTTLVHVAVAAPGGVMGLAGGSLYAAVLLKWFEALWQPQGSLRVLFHVEPLSLLTAWGVAVGLAGTMSWVAPQRIKAWPVSALLHGWEPAFAQAGRRWLPRLWLGVGLLLATGAAAAGWLTREAGHASRVAWFLLTGVGVLMTGLALLRLHLEPKRGVLRLPRFTQATLARRNTERNPARGVLISGMIACAVFLLVVVELFQPVDDHPQARGSGTGGFALLMETAAPVYADLNSPAGRKRYGLPETALDGVRFCGFRVRPGDDAGCRNLGRAQEPRLLGVKADGLRERGAFTFLATLGPAALPKGGAGWTVLDAELGPDVVPAVVDETTLMWGLEKSLGDELTYVDESGRPFRVRLVGMLANSVLQGSVLISDRALQSRYPSLAGEKFYLIDVPAGREPRVADTLTFRLQDSGAAVAACTEVLADLGAVTILYLKLFQTLGGLGLLLGVGVVALVVLRNAFERRGELAVLRSVGFARYELVRLLVGEQAWLVAWGIVLGGTAAWAAVAPALDRQAVGAVLWPGLTRLLAGVAAAGLLASACAAWAATRSTPLEALRED